MAPLFSNGGGRADFDIAQGDDYTLPLYVADTDGTPFSWVGATVTAPIGDGHQWTVDKSTPGVLTLSVSEADTNSMPLATVITWLRVVRDGVTRTWFSGNFKVRPPGEIPDEHPAHNPEHLSVRVGVNGGRIAITSFPDPSMVVQEVFADPAFEQAIADVGAASFLASGIITSVTPSGGDDTTAISNALTAGDVMLVSNGAPFHMNRIVYEGASRRIFALGPVTIIQTAGLGCFSLRGGFDVLGTVNSSAVITNADLVYPGESNPASSNTTVTQLTLASAATVARADVVKIVSDDEHTWGRPEVTAAKYRQGEYSTVGIASTGTTVTLTNVLYETHATNVRLVRQQDVRFVIEGPITFDTDPTIRDLTVYGAVVELRAARDCYIGKGVRFFNSVGRAIGNYTYAALFEGIQFRNLANRSSKSQFGYGVQDGGHGTRMIGCHGERLRHLYSEGANTVNASSANFEYYGGGSYANIVGCTGFACEGQPFDTHGTAYNVTFTGCKAIATFVGVGSGGQGFASRGRGTKFMDCEAHGGFRGFVIGGKDTKVINCHTSACRYTAIEFSPDVADSSQQLVQDGTEVIGGTWSTTGATRTMLLASTAGYTLGLRVESATIRPVLPTNGHSCFNMGLTAAQTNVATRVTIKDLRVDLTRAAIANGVTVLSTASDTITLRGNGLAIEHEGSLVTTVTIMGGGGAGAGWGADLEFEDLRFDSSNVTPTVLGSNFTNGRYTYQGKVNTGSAATHYPVSSDITVASAASAVLPTTRLLDKDITCRITGGSAASVSFTALPLVPRQNGARLTLINKSTDTVTQNAVVLAPNAVARWVYSGGAWVAA